MVSKSRIYIVGSKTSNQNIGKDVPSHVARQSPGYPIYTNFKNFCSSTGLHGFAYLTDEQISPTDRFLWRIIVTLALSTTVFLLWMSWNWNEKTKTITVIETTHFPTMFVPFPAITICPMNKIAKRKAFQIASVWKRPTNMTVEELMDQFRLLLHFSTGNLAPKSNYSDLQEILDRHNTSVPDLLAFLAPNCFDIFLKCLWKGVPTDCKEIFQKINTSVGSCCSFNYLGPTTHQPINLAPQRLSKCGYESGLSVLLKPDSVDYFATQFHSIGYELMIHDAYNYPDTSSGKRLISRATLNFLNILPESTYAPSNVRSVDISDRYCVFPEERKLMTFHKYSFGNCMAECESRIAFETCGCLPPFFLNIGNYTPCRLVDIECFVQNKPYISGSLPGVNVTFVTPGNNFKSKCDCLKDCNSFRYPGELVRADLRHSLSFQDLNYFANGTTGNELVLHAYFNDLVSSRYRQDVYHSWIETLALFGGILELVIGLSFVTGFEFLYYFTIRPVFDYFAKKRIASAMPVI